MDPRVLIGQYFCLLSLTISRGRANVSPKAADVKAKFEDAGIVPELISNPPLHPMEVLYKSKTVNFGNEFTREDFETQPTHLQWPTENNRLYTLIFTDPDCPKRSLPIDKEWQHWVVVNIPGCNVLKGETLSQYIGGLPYYLLYPHRYVFLAYLQPDESPAEFDEPRLDHKPIEQERYHFSTTEFVEKYNLGVPVAGNYFMAGGPEPTEEVPPILRHLLSSKKPVEKNETATTTSSKH